MSNFFEHKKSRPTGDRLKVIFWKGGEVSSQGGIRTHMPYRTPDFKSGAETSFATWPKKVSN